jgi:hypothetical protein
MNQEKYIGMDVHAATISAAVKNAQGKLLMECVLETKVATILEFIQGLRGTGRCKTRYKVVIITRASNKLLL